MSAKQKEYTGFRPALVSPGDQIRLPAETGYYWATSRQYGWRCVVLIRRNGHGHLRAFVPWMSGSFDVTSFADFIGPLVDPAAPVSPAEGGE